MLRAGWIVIGVVATLTAAVPTAAAAPTGTVLVSVDSSEGQANAASGGALVAAGGRYVVFQTRARLVARDTNGVMDVYLRDTVRGMTYRISVSGKEQQAN